MMPEQAGTRVVLDFAGTTGEGITLCGNYWYIQNIDVTNSANGKDGIHVAGSYNVLDSVNTYNNGNTGIQISRFQMFRLSQTGQHTTQLRMYIT